MRGCYFNISCFPSAFPVSEGTFSPSVYSLFFSLWEILAFVLGFSCCFLGQEEQEGFCWFWLALKTRDVARCMCVCECVA